MKQKYRSIQVFSLSRSGQIRPQQPICHRHKILNTDLSQSTTPRSVSSDSIQYIPSSIPSVKTSRSKINSSFSKADYQHSFDFEPVKNFHRNRVKDERKRAKYIKSCPLLKIIGCFLVTLLVAAGVATLIIGLIFINQKNTSTTTTTEKTSLTTIAASSSSTATASSSTTTAAAPTTVMTSITTTTPTTISTTIITTTTITTTPTTVTTVASTTTVSHIQFALTQIIAGYTVTCSSVDNTNVSYTECDDFQRTSLYGAGTTSCLSAWSTTLSTYWSANTLCQAFLGSPTATSEMYYDCSAATLRFTYLSNTWGTVNDTKYTKNVRCYY